MIRFALFGIIALALAGCGAGGPPQPPTPMQPGITISGSATMGMARDGT